jgi:hypothetical protein
MPTPTLTQRCTQRYPHPLNKGKEAMLYITYIIEKYHNLPATIAFIHSHENGYPKARHNDKTSCVSKVVRTFANFVCSMYR